MKGPPVALREQAAAGFAKRHGVAPGMHTASVEFTTRWLEAGFQMVMLGADRAFMARQAGADLAAARATANVERVTA